MPEKLTFEGWQEDGVDDGFFAFTCAVCGDYINVPSWDFRSEQQCPCGRRYGLMDFGAAINAAVRGKEEG